MRAGRLRHRLKLQSRTETRDAYGGVVTTWTTEKIISGALEPLTGQEFFNAQQTQSEVAVRVVIRYDSAIQDTWRIKNDSKIYSIVSIINEMERDRMMTIMCRQGVVDDEADAGSSFMLNQSGDYLLNELGDQLILEA